MEFHWRKFKLVDLVRTGILTDSPYICKIQLVSGLYLYYKLTTNTNCFFLLYAVDSKNYSGLVQLIGNKLKPVKEAKTNTIVILDVSVDSVVNEYLYQTTLDLDSE